VPKNTEPNWRKAAQNTFVQKGACKMLMKLTPGSIYICRTISDLSDLKLVFRLLINQELISGLAKVDEKT